MRPKFRVEPTDHRFLRARLAHAFQEEVLFSQLYNTSLDTVRELGWYLWLYFARRSKITRYHAIYGRMFRFKDEWTPNEVPEGWEPDEWTPEEYLWYNPPYSDIVRPDFTMEDMRDLYESRFREAIKEWRRTKGKQSRLGTNFLAFVCFRDRSNVSNRISSWAKQYNDAIDSQSPKSTGG